MENGHGNDVSFLIENGGSFHSYVAAYQRVIEETMAVEVIKS